MNKINNFQYIGIINQGSWGDLYWRKRGGEMMRRLLLLGVLTFLTVFAAMLAQSYADDTSVGDYYADLTGGDFLAKGLYPEYSIIDAMGWGSSGPLGGGPPGMPGFGSGSGGSIPPGDNVDPEPVFVPGQPGESTTTPEPATLFLLGSGLVGLGTLGRKQFQKK
jgi:hypothetical protein